MVAGAGQEAEAGAGALKEKPEAGAVMIKFALDISKKIFASASIFILAVVLTIAGMVSDSEPSFGVLAVITVGYVNPPSVDRLIMTFATFTGGVLVPATSHIIV
jgi:hypothetical protein